MHIDDLEVFTAPGGITRYECKICLAACDQDPGWLNHAHYCKYTDPKEALMIFIDRLRQQNAEMLEKARIEKEPTLRDLLRVTIENNRKHITKALHDYHHL